MHRLFVFFSVFILGVNALPPLPKRCCMAQRFSASLTDLRTINAKKMSILSVTMDFEKEMKAVVTAEFDPATQEIVTTEKVIFKYKQSMMYRVFLNNSTCTPTQNDRPMVPRCVPPSSQYLGTAYLGLPTTLPYDAWRFPLFGNRANMTMAFSKQGCVPIIEGVVERLSSGPVDNFYLFSSYSVDKLDSTVFDLPPSCGRTTAFSLVGK